MSELLITGVVQLVQPRIDTQGQSGVFSKRDIVVRTDEQFPQDIAVQFTQDKCDLLDLYKPGESVTIAFNLRGKAGGWTNPQGEVKYFNTIQGWKISRNGAVPATPPSPSAPASSGMVYRHTDSIPEVEYRKNPAWTTEVLVANGKGVMVAANAPTPPPAPQGVQQQANFSQAAPDDDLPF